MGDLIQLILIFLTIVVPAVWIVLLGIRAAIEAFKERFP